MKRLVKDQRGAAAVEFALVGPMLIVMLLGIMGYGGYFWIAHAVQQLANDAARQAAVGLDTAERRMLAQRAVANDAVSYAYLNARGVATHVEEWAGGVTVRVQFDGATTPFWAIAAIAPMPPSMVTRTASISLGGL